jgi:hypothetical protein
MYLYSRRLTAQQLHNFLTGQEGAPGDKAFIILERGDHRVDWQDLERHRSPQNASVNVGQLWDFRRAVPGGSALHIHVFENHVTVHLDVHDPAHRPVKHLLGETYLVRGVAIGGGAALALGLATGPGVVLAAIGALIGGNSNVGARYLSLARMDWNGTAWFTHVEPVAARAMLTPNAETNGQRRISGGSIRR